MISIGSCVKVKSGGETGRVIRMFDHLMELLLVIRLDAPDRFGCEITTAWESEVEAIEAAAERVQA